MALPSGSIDYQNWVPDYELLAEEGLKDVYDSEPEDCGSSVLKVSQRDIVLINFPT